jgi:hypothetical protein
VGLPIGLGPLEFLWVVLSFEMSVTLRPAEFEDSTVIPHELDAVSRVNWTPTEETFFDSHLFMKDLFNLKQNFNQGSQRLSL